MQTCPRCSYTGDDAAAGVCPRCDHDFTLDFKPGRRFATMNAAGPEVTLTLDPNEPPLEKRRPRCTRCGLETDTAPCRRCGGPGITVFTPAERAVLDLFNQIRVAAAAAAERREHERRDAWQSFVYALLVGLIGVCAAALILGKLAQGPRPAPAAQAEAEAPPPPPPPPPPAGHKLVGFGLDAGQVPNSWGPTWGAIDEPIEPAALAALGGPAVGAIHANNARAR